MLLCVLVCFVSACGKTSTDETPLRGLYRSAGGSGFIFNSDGTFDTTERVSGRYTVEGTHVVLTIADRSLNAERVSNDELLLPAQHGHAEEHWYRAGSEAAASAASTARASEPPRAPKESAAPTPKATEPAPADRSKPLDDYSAVDPSDPAAARYLLAAFGPTALTDDQKLSFLSVEGSRTSDVFARKELAAKELPGIDARLASTRQHRYVRVDAVEPVYQGHAPAAARTMAVWQPPVPGFGHYDLDRKGFPVGCMTDSSVSFGGTYVSFHPTMVVSGKHCFLAVPDEGVARVLETAVSRSGGIVPMAVSLYFAVDGAATRIGPQTLSATLTHVTLRVYPADVYQEGVKPVASFDIDVPQPTM
jgi:hypothetical protein